MKRLPSLARARTGAASAGTIVLIALTFLLAVAVWIYAHRDLPAIDRTKAEGLRIVAAVQAYHHDTGHYPDSLPLLVPKYLAAIAPPPWGLRVWNYKHYAEPTRPGAEAGAPAPGGGRVAEYFELSVPANASYYPVLFYDVTDQRWILNN